jgi:hypothetical protein
MTNVKMPIKTVREGNKITKVCVEDVYKMLNRIIEKQNITAELLESLHKTVETEDGAYVPGEFIIGKGISQPCLTDAFDEEIGSNIAFMKAKLNANFKKYRFLNKVWNSLVNTMNTVDNELDRVSEMMLMDLDGIRKHNPEYLDGIEYELGIFVPKEDVEDEELDC